MTQPNTPTSPSGPAGATAAKPAAPSPADQRAQALDLAIQSYTSTTGTSEIVERATAFAKFIIG